MQSLTFEELQLLFRTKIIESDSNLNDFRPGSVLETLCRSISYIAYQQHEALKSLEQNLFLDTAKGESLDRIGEAFNIFRKQGRKAYGSVLITAFNAKEPIKILAEGSVLVDPVSVREYKVLSQTDISKVSLIEKKVAVQALKVGSEYNLSPGTKLLSGDYPLLNIIVGSHRTPKGEVCGNIQQGTNIEADSDYRKRILDTLLNSRYSNKQAIITALMSESLVNWVIVEVPRAGYCQVWIDSDIELSDMLLKRYLSIVEDRVPAGILVDVEQIKRINVDFEILLIPKISADLDDLGSKIKTKISSLLQSLGSNIKVELKSMIESEITKELNKDINSITVVEPTEVYSVEYGEVLRVNSFLVRYSI
jgi:hypothetical protein